MIWRYCDVVNNIICIYCSVLLAVYLSTYIHNTVEHSYNKPDIPGQTVCYEQEFVISEQFPIRYCSTWLRSLLCYTKKLFIEEFVTRVFHCKTV